ncbi:MAG: MarR family transcriptional regulator [Delftia lacustris]|uniref:MarR family winged helix-turn-helix transcriptional regulator n=1 Tax=Delftia lacustris TaxID=558537 RepID=UPI002F3EAA0A
MKAVKSTALSSPSFDPVSPASIHSHESAQDRCRTSPRIHPLAKAPEALRPHLALMAQTAQPGTDTPAAGLGLLLLWLADDVEQRANASLQAFGLSESKLDVLMIFGLAERGLLGDTVVTPSYIASYVGVTRSSVTGLLDWLEKRSLLARSLSQEDRRSFDLALTDQGREVLARALPAFWRMCESLVDYLDEGERASLQSLLFKAWTRMKAQQAA